MPEQLAAGVIALALVIYALTGGADFGGGILDLTARGPRGAELRALISRAIGPIWEANHVWLILVVVVCFVCLPGAFSAIMTGLHLPLLIMLLGVVGRGVAFVFRAYDDPDEHVQRGWSLLFSLSSLLTPMALGTNLGALAAGAADPGLPGRWIGPWLAPFPLVVGALVTCSVTQLAACHLTNETSNTALQDELRLRGLVAGGVCGALALLGLILARSGAPGLYAGLVEGPGMLVFHGVTAACAIGGLVGLVRRRWALARLLVGGQVALVALGWALAQWPLAVPPSLSISEVAAPREVIVPVLWALGLGAVGLLPALGFLYSVFHQRTKA